MQHPPICIMTRLRVRSVLGLWTLFLMYRRIRKATRGLEGLIVASFLIEDWRTFITFSLWSESSAILRFNVTVEHIMAANRSFGLVEWVRSKPIIWSGQFRLEGVSRFNHEWNELASLIGPAG